ncbi:MAG: GGDEF domain-containing protein [Patescibacteria group bacterium]
MDAPVPLTPRNPRVVENSPRVFEAQPNPEEIRERFRLAEKTVSELLKLVAPRCNELIDGTGQPTEVSVVMGETRRLVLEMFENLREMERLFGLPENFVAALERIGRSVSTSMNESAPELRRFRMISESLDLLRKYLEMDYAGIWLLKDGKGVPLHESGTLHPSSNHGIIEEQVALAIEGTKDGRFAYLDPSDSEDGGVDAVFIFRNIEGKPIGYLLLDDYDTAHDIDMDQISQIAETYYVHLHAVIHEEESALAKKELLDIKSELERMRSELHNTRFDQLTGLLRKDAAEELLKNAIERVRRTEGSAVLCMIDIDHFKKVNDTHGHLMGNEVLSKLGNVLTGKGDGYTPRRIDIPCRWGGEEFIMLFDETNEAGATSAAERISAAIKKLRFKDGNSGEEFGITVTVGMVGVRTAEVREIPRETDLLAHYFELADRALYYGKRNGRDQIVSYEAGKTDPENAPSEPTARQTARRVSRSISETIDGTSANRKFGKKKAPNAVRGRIKVT